MIPAERLEKIKTEIEKNGFISVNDLSQRLGISLSTVRRDLIDLENEGIIIRTHGGAEFSGHKLTMYTTQSSRVDHYKKEKEKIGRFVAKYIENCGCVVMDTGTTTLEIARNLKPEKPLRVITDSIEIAYELRDRENIIVLVIGGILGKDSYNLYGNFGENMLDSMHAQVCVLGTVGLTIREGLTKYEIEALPIRRKMIEISNKLICVSDNSKFGLTGLVSVCPIDRIDCLVTDNGIKADFKKALKKLGIEVIVVE